MPAGDYRVTVTAGTEEEATVGRIRERIPAASGRH